MADPVAEADPLADPAFLEAVKERIRERIRERITARHKSGTALTAPTVPEDVYAARRKESEEFEAGRVEALETEAREFGQTPEERLEVNRRRGVMQAPRKPGEMKREVVTVPPKYERTVGREAARLGAEALESAVTGLKGIEAGVMLPIEAAAETVAENIPTAIRERQAGALLPRLPMTTALSKGEDVSARTGSTGAMRALEQATEFGASAVIPGVGMVDDALRPAAGLLKRAGGAVSKREAASLLERFPKDRPVPQRKSVADAFARGEKVVVQHPDFGKGTLTRIHRTGAGEWGVRFKDGLKDVDPRTLDIAEGPGEVVAKGAPARPLPSPGTPGAMGVKEAQHIIEESLRSGDEDWIYHRLDSFGGWYDTRTGESVTRGGLRSQRNMGPRGIRPLEADRGLREARDVIAGSILGALQGVPKPVLLKGGAAGAGAGLGAAVAPEGQEGRYAVGGGLLGAGVAGAARRAMAPGQSLLKRAGAALDVVGEAKRTGDAVLSILPKGVAAVWNRVIPVRQQAAIARAVATEGERAHPVVAQAVDDALANYSRTTAFGYSRAVALRTALKPMGALKRGSQRQVEFHEFMGGRATKPAWLTGDAETAALEGKAYLKGLAKRHATAKGSTQETYDEYWSGVLEGWLPTDYAAAPGKKGGILGIFRPPTARTRALSGLTVKKDAEGVIIKATPAEVEAALQRVAPGFRALRRASEQEGWSVLKTGRGPRAEAVADALAAEFPRDGVERFREIDLATRLGWKEKTEPVERFMSAVEEMEARVTAAEMLADIHRGMAVPTIRPGYVRLPKDPGLGMLSDSVVPEEVAKWVTERGATLSEMAKAINGVQAAMREAYVATPRGTWQNLNSNLWEYSLYTDVHPILNPDALPRWIAGVKDLVAFKRKGTMSPNLKRFVENGGDLKQITDDLVDELDRVANALGTVPDDLDSFHRAKVITQIMGGSPHLSFRGAGAVGRAVDSAASAVVGGAHGAIRGALTGQGAIAEAGISAAQQMGAHEVARQSRFMFGAMDPLYRLVAFGKQYDLALTDGLIPQDAARKAIRETHKWSQEFRPEMLQEAFNIATGRKALMGEKGPRTGLQMAAKVAVPSFLTFPLNQVRIHGRGLVEKPLSALLALGQKRIVRNSAIAGMVGSGIWTAAEAAKFERQHPNEAPTKVGDQVILVDVSRQFPGIETLTDTWKGIPMGILPAAGFKAATTGGAALSGDTKAVEPHTGFNIIRPDEAQAPGAAVHRAAVEGSFGGPLAPHGSARMQIEDALSGKKDIGGQKRSLTETVISILGPRVRSYAEGSEDRRARTVYDIELNKAEKRYRRAKGAPGATAEDKARAKATFDAEKKRLQEDRDKVLKGSPR